MINYGRITDYKIMHDEYSNPTYEMTIEGVRDINRIDALSEILNHLDVFDNVDKVKALKNFLESGINPTTKGSYDMIMNALYSPEEKTKIDWTVAQLGRCNGKEALKMSLNAIYGTQSLRYGIDKVIFNDPATIVLWKDRTKTVVKCGDKDIYDPEKGLAMAICKKIAGNTGNYYDIFKKWIPRNVVEELRSVGESYFAGISEGKDKPDHSFAESYCDVISDVVAKFTEAVRKVYGEKNDEPEN